MNEPTLREIAQAVVTMNRIKTGSHYDIGMVEILSKIVNYGTFSQTGKAKTITITIKDWGDGVNE